MDEERILVVRLSSMGDILHTVPAVSALRASFPAARLDWLVDERWRSLVEAVRCIDKTISLGPSPGGGVLEVLSSVRRSRYSWAIDFQGLYKSALLMRFCGARRRVGFAPPTVRERGASLFYSERVGSSSIHVIDQCLSLVEHLGARPDSRETSAMFPLRISSEATAFVDGALTSAGVGEYFVMSPSGGWISKCWPAERYGELHRRLGRRFGYRGLISYGPGERGLAEALRQAAGQPEPVLLEMDVPQLMAALRRAQFFVGGDSGPLHLAVAVGAPVVGLYGPTDPARNGPYCPADIVIRNARPEHTTHRRGTTISDAMLSITVEQVEEAVVRRMAQVPSEQKQ